MLIALLLVPPIDYGLRDYGTAEWEGGDEGCDHVGPALGGVGKETLDSTTADENKTRFQQYKTVCKKCGAKRIDKQIGLEESPQEYVAKLVEVFRECWRVLRDDGCMFVNLGDSFSSGGKRQTGSADNGRPDKTKGWAEYDIKRSVFDSVCDLPPKNLLGMPWRLAFALQDDGWILRNDIIWNKKNCLPESVTDRFTKSHEYVFFFVKQARYWFDQDAVREEASSSNRAQPTPKMKTIKPSDTEWQDNRYAPGAFGYGVCSNGRNKRDVFTLSSESYRHAHFATFPKKLVEPLLLAGCPHKACAECGSPWVRVVETEDKGFADNRSYRSPHNTQTSWNSNGSGKTTLSKNIERTTVNFTPTCECNAATKPGLVLDPFFGSGTVGAVAVTHGRDWLGIDLNSEYIEMAKRRIYQTQPGLPLEF